MTGPLRYTDRDPFAAIAEVEFTDEESAAIIGPSNGFDIYHGMRIMMNMCTCSQCTMDIVDMLARKRNVYRRPVRR